jgi:hypothetical protein
MSSLNAWLRLAGLTSRCAPLFAGLLLLGCPDDKSPGFECDCEAGQVCRDGVCVDPDAGFDVGDQGADFIDNPSCPGSGIVISEVMYTPASGSPEWVEIRGPAGRDLTGFRLVHINGNGGNEIFNLALRGGLGDEGIYLIASTPMIEADQSESRLIMQNGPDNIVLLDCSGQRVDALGYGNFGATDVFRGEGLPAPGTRAGQSLARCADAPDTNNNAEDFHVVTEPTPGEENDGFVDPFACAPCEPGAFEGEVVINEVLYNPDGTDTVNNEFLELRGQPDQDLTGLRIEWVNGANGLVYMSLGLDGVFADGDGLFVIGGPVADVALPGVQQNGPDGVRLVNCSEDVIDALGYGRFGETDVLLSEGDPAPDPGSGRSLARCGDSADSDDNAADFRAATPTPGQLNEGFRDPLACGGNFCGPGLLDGRLVVNEIVPGAAGFIELRGDANIGLGLVMVEVLAADGSLAEEIDVEGSTDAAGFISFTTSAMANAGGTVLVRDCEDRVVDALAWGTGTSLQGEGPAAPAPGAGQGLGRCPGATLAAVDTNNNAADFALVDAPTRGAPNSGFVDPERCGLAACDPDSLRGRVLINEVLPDPVGADAGKEWVELRGVPGLSVAGAELFFVNGADGRERLLSTLSGRIRDDGLYVIGTDDDEARLPGGATGDIQNDNESIYLACGGEVIDAVAWGVFANPDFARGEGNPAPEPNNGRSIARCARENLADADSDDNETDFHLDDTPTRGSPNFGLGPICGEPLCNPGTFNNLVVINEVRPGTGGFIELRATPALSLEGIQITGHQASGVVAFTRLLTATDTTNANGFFAIDVSELGLIGGSVILTDCEGGVIDALAWGTGTGGEGTPATAPGAGQSLGRCDGAADTNDNASDFVLISSPSRGTANGTADTEACTGPVPLALFTFDEDSLQPTVVAANVEVTDFSVSAGTVSFFAGSPGKAVSSTSWTDVNSKYWEFGVTPELGFEVVLSEVRFDEAISGTGPPRWEVHLVDSTDTVRVVGSGENTGTTSPLSFVRHVVVIEGEASGPYSGTVRVRLAGFGGGAGTWRIDNVTLMGGASLAP